MAARDVQLAVHEPPPRNARERKSQRPEAGLQTCFFFSSRRRHTRWTGDWSFRRVLFRSRDLPGLTVLAGFSGHGFKLAPVIGEIAAELALTGRSPLPIPLFDPHRFDG